MQIHTDVFDIADRLKEIDPNYTLHYNFHSKKFELRGKKGELQLVFPYDKIDARMVELARKTRIERSREFIREMDLYNQRLTEQREREATEVATENLKEIAGKHYATKGKRYY